MAMVSCDSSAPDGRRALSKRNHDYIAYVASCWTRADEIAQFRKKAMRVIAAEVSVRVEA
jgi:hypothetical protein